MTGSLTGRTAVVTGASRGIGLAAARSLASAGARVVMLARSEKALRAEATRLGDLAIPLSCDIGDPARLTTVVARLREHVGPAPDVLVNNAGVFELARVDEMSIADFAAMVHVNLMTPFALVRAFLGEMRLRGSGHVVTVGSIADRATFPENGAYAATKFGLRALHQVMREELRGSGVRATLVSPGPVDTALWDTVEPDKHPGFTPRSAMLSPAAVADAILFAVTRSPATNIDELRLSRA